MTKEHLVVRTLYIPLDADRRLARIASERGVSKSDLVRTILREQLASRRE